MSLLVANHTYTYNTFFYGSKALRSLILEGGYFVLGKTSTTWDGGDIPPMPDPTEKNIIQPAVYLRPLATNVLLAARSSSGLPRNAAYRQEPITGSDWYLYTNPSEYTKPSGAPNIEATNVWTSVTVSKSIFESISNNATAFRVVGFVMYPTFDNALPGQTVFPADQVVDPGTLVWICYAQAQPLVVDNSEQTIKIQVIF